ncbi:MAG: prolyl oligopeptidase family serine peptidase [Clostridiales bacterium]|nr:prolyl oligopeptidase family serine peptidase [Clostridiales bacterium]
MKSVITYDNMSGFAYSNDKICKKPIKGIVLSFFGLGGCSMFSEESPEGIFYAEQGMLYVVPYNNPWNWMNRQAVSYTDEILDVLFARYGLDSDIPVVSTGGSMGGLSALVYACQAKRTPISCVANCPVCDLVFHYGERHDLPRTLYSAFYHEGETLEEALKTASPLHLIPRMPGIDYHIFHCDQDEAVNITRHSEAFVSAMREQGHRVTYDIVPGRGHCDLTEEMNQRFLQYVTTAIEDAGR